MSLLLYYGLSRKNHSSKKYGATFPVFYVLGPPKGRLGPEWPFGIFGPLRPKALGSEGPCGPLGPQGPKDVEYVELGPLFLLLWVIPDKRQ